jgi:hypothetical protein
LHVTLSIPEESTDADAYPINAAGFPRSVAIAKRLEYPVKSKGVPLGFLGLMTKSY